MPNCAAPSGALIPPYPPKGGRKEGSMPKPRAPSARSHRPCHDSALSPNRDFEEKRLAGRRGGEAVVDLLPMDGQRGRRGNVGLTRSTPDEPTRAEICNQQRKERQQVALNGERGVKRIHDITSAAAPNTLQR